MSTSGVMYLPNISEVRAIVLDEVSALGLSSFDQWEDEDRLFVRAALQRKELVCEGDVVFGGIALRVDGPDVFVHPYTLRQVCENGAIAAATTRTEYIERLAVEVETASAAFAGAVEHELRAAIRACANPAYLTVTVDGMRTAAELNADMLMAMLPHLIYLPEETRREVLASVAGRVEMSSDPSAFGLINVVTAIAREATDPDMRWELERAGGKLIAQAAELAATGRRWQLHLASA